SVTAKLFPSGSGRLATSRKRAAISPMPLPLIRSRENRACVISPVDKSFSAAAQSLAFAAKIRSAFPSSASAIAKRVALRVWSERRASFRDASRAECAIEATSVTGLVEVEELSLKACAPAEQCYLE